MMTVQDGKGNSMIRRVILTLWIQAELLWRYRTV